MSFIFITCTYILDGRLEIRSLSYILIFLKLAFIILIIREKPKDDF